MKKDKLKNMAVHPNAVPNASEVSNRMFIKPGEKRIMLNNAIPMFKPAIFNMFFASTINTLLSSRILYSLN